MSPHGLFIVKINEYVGKDIYNYDTLTTTGSSINLQAGKNPIGGVGLNQENREKEGITRHTVLGDIEIGSARGTPINKDITKANEVTKDTHSSTNIYVEGQTIDYITNPSRFKEDLGKAKQEIKDIGTAIKESINDRGDNNRNFLGQLGEGRLRTTIDNIAGKRLENAKDQNEIGRAFEDAYKDLGYNAKVIYTDPSKALQLIDESGNIKSGTAYVGKDGVHTIIINTKDPKNSTRSGIIGTISEEGSHIIGKIEGRQLQTGTEEKGLESTGRATNEYFTDKYKKNDIPIETKSDGKDYSSTDFGENVGDAGGACLGGTLLSRCIKSNEQFVDKVNKVDRQEALKVFSFIADFTALGTPKGIIEGITGKDLLTGEEINLLSRVLGLLPIIKKGYKGAKIGFKLLKGTEKAELLLSDGTKIVLKADEIKKLEKTAEISTKPVKSISKVVSNLENLDKNKIYHIINGSKNSNHKWEKLVPDKNWNDIKKVVGKVLDTGVEKSYKGVFSKVAKINGFEVEVIYSKLENGTIKISNAWIR